MADVVPLFQKHTLKSICATAMGTLLSQLGKEDDYAFAIREFGHNVFYRIPRPWYHLDWLFNLSERGRIQKKCLQILHGFSKKIIEERKKYHDQKTDSKQNGYSAEEEKIEDDIGVRKKRTAMLDVLISSAREKGDIDDAGIREEVDTFVFEGHDTTAVGFIFTVALIAENKEIQRRARNEVSEILNETGGYMGMKEINSFSYLDRCIKDGLRLYPSVPTIAREIKEDLQLRKFLIPTGSMIHVHIFDLHIDPNFCANPEVYDPDRFLPQEVQKRHPFSYIAFSAGSRNCIGKKFAMLELKAMIAHLLYHFEMEAIDLAHKVVILQDLVITPANPVRVSFTALKK